MSFRTHGRCVNIVLLHGTCLISMKTLVSMLKWKIKKNSLLKLVLLFLLTNHAVLLLLAVIWTKMPPNFTHQNLSSLMSDRVSYASLTLALNSDLKKNKIELVLPEIIAV